MIRKFYLLCLFVVCLTPLCGQVEYLNRYEIENSWENLNYVVISNEERGAMFVKHIAQSAGRSKRIEFSHLDQELKEEWTGFFETSKSEFLKGYHYHNNVTYLLFQVSSDNRIIKIVALDGLKKEVRTFEPKQIVDLNISEFEAIKGSAIIGGYIEGRPAVFVYDMVADAVRTLPNVYQNNSELMEVRVNSDSVTFNVIASELDDKKDRTILVNTYDYEGNLVRGYQLETDTEHQLLSGVSSSIIDKAQVIMGLYSVKTGTYPSGYYINHVDRTGRQTMKYLNFGEFESFLDHTGKRRASKMKARALAAKENQKEWRYKIDVIFREMIELDDKLIIAGEFYKPWTVSTNNQIRNRINSSSLSGFNDDFINPMTVRRGRNLNTGNGIIRPPDFSFTHAFALAVDLKGEVLWDASFDIKENPESALQDFGAFQWQDDETYYAYYHDRELVVKNLNDTEDKKGLSSPLALLSEEEELRYEKDDFRGVTRWYGNKVLVYGIQHVRSPDRSSGIRKVFFINSVELGPKTVASKLD
ncbi:hypothetical protein [Roseivirga sp. E12]|uniref:hypothetical protein n=1 Tax=Roseivirga sp. E12 TaxID=2819237 RepID=UPI001ABBF321|nr:hypothetical protein [Roseivirga sp. E12]MBO3700759.1 hypothetical protein [Roseivirga sp. E12]